MARGREEAARVVEYAERVMALPYLNLHILDGTSARRAIAMATQRRLRGADALYVAAAEQYGARLVTLDAEQLERAPRSVAACKPDAAVRLLRASTGRHQRTER
jgi:predicted nucleic acid-binding protein